MQQIAPDWPDSDAALLEAVYSLQCTSRMNAIYYELRLSKLQCYAFWLEVIAAVAASSSGVASLVAQTVGPLGMLAQQIWPVVAIAAAIAAVIKPIYAPGRRIEACTRQHQGYVADFFALRKLAFCIRQEGRITDEHRRRYDTVFDRHIQLSTESEARDEATPSDRYRRIAEQRTRTELPAEKFWWPGLGEVSPQRGLQPAE